MLSHTFRICQVVSNIIKSINSVLYIKIIQNSSQWFSLNSPLSQTTTTTTHVFGYIPLLLNCVALCEIQLFIHKYLSKIAHCFAPHYFCLLFHHLSRASFFMIMLSSLSINMKHLWIMLKVLSKFAWNLHRLCTPPPPPLYIQCKFSSLFYHTSLLLCVYRAQLFMRHSRTDRSALLSPPLLLILFISFFSAMIIKMLLAIKIYNLIDKNIYHLVNILISCTRDLWRIVIMVVIVEARISIIYIFIWFLW